MIFKATATVLIMWLAAAASGVSLAEDEAWMKQAPRDSECVDSIGRLRWLVANATGPFSAAAALAQWETPAPESDYRRLAEALKQRSPPAVLLGQQ